MKQCLIMVCISLTSLSCLGQNDDSNWQELIEMRPPDTVAYEQLIISGDKHENSKIYFYNYKRYTGVVIKTVKQGGNIFYYHVENGLLQRQIGYYLSGQLFRDFSYVDGVTHGEMKVFHENGQQKIAYTSVDGQVEGTFIMWDEDGNITRELTYKAGKVIPETD